MNRIVNLHDRAVIEEEAAAWVWRLDDESATPETRAAFEAWRAQSPAHAKAYADLSDTWDTLDDLVGASPDDRLTRHAARIGVQRRRARIAVAAALAASLLIVAFVTFQLMPRGKDAYVTAVGEQSVAALDDGSVVRLNTDTRIEVAYLPERRVVRLLQGEAHFDVAHDTSRPFEVIASGKTVRAVGTAFNVRVGAEGGLEVLVDEGRVEVRDALAVTAEPPLEPVAAPDLSSLALAKEEPIAALTAGQRMVIASVAPEPLVAEAPARPAAEPVALALTARVETVDERTMERALSWQEGVLIFDGEPLGEALAEVSRYTRTSFRVEDEAVSAMRIGGRFRTGDVAGFVDALESALPVEVRRLPNGEVVVGAKG